MRRHGVLCGLSVRFWCQDRQPISRWGWCRGRIYVGGCLGVSDGFGAGPQVPMGLVPDVMIRWGWCRTTSSDGVGAGLQGYDFPDGVGAGIELMKPQRTMFGMHRGEGPERVHGVRPKVQVRYGLGPDVPLRHSSATWRAASLLFETFGPNAASMRKCMPSCVCSFAFLFLRGVGRS